MSIVSTNAQTTGGDASLDDQCKKQLDLAVKMGNQLLDELKACKDTSEKRLIELQKVENKTKIQLDKIEDLEELVVNLRERIKELEAIKCTEFTLVKLFWVIKLGHFKKCS